MKCHCVCFSKIELLKEDGKYAVVNGMTILKLSPDFFIV